MLGTAVMPSGVHRKDIDSMVEWLRTLPAEFELLGATDDIQLRIDFTKVLYANNGTH